MLSGINSRVLDEARMDCYLAIDYTLGWRILEAIFAQVAQFNHG
jgi:hypothetical protein